MKNVREGLPSTVASRPEAYSSAATNGPGVEAHFAVVIEKAAILRQGEKSGPAKKLPIHTTGVEAHFTVVIKKAAVLRQGEKGGPTKKLPICLVQQIVSEEFARIPDDNGFVTVCRQSGEIFTQVGMHDEKRPQVPTPEKLLRYSGWRIDVFHRHLKSELREVTDDAAKRAARRVGDELEGKLRRPNL